MAGSLFRQAGMIVLATLFLSALHTHSITAQEGAATQTIVFIRHAEKPKGGFGQLACQGLNRALALAQLLGQPCVPDNITAERRKLSRLNKIDLNGWLLEGNRTPFKRE
jgi:hypothetical protein